MPSSIADAERPIQYVHDPRTDTVELTVDVLPATVEDVTVTAGSHSITVAVERADRTDERTFAPPVGRSFTDDRTAVYTNGILTVTVGTTET